MGSTYDSNPFDGEEPDTFANSRPEPADYGGGSKDDVPLNSTNDLRAKEKELEAKEAELNRREEELKRKEDAIARARIFQEEKNWPPFFPLIHHDIPKEIPLHQQRTQYVAFTTLLGIVVCLIWNLVAVTVAWIAGEVSYSLLPICFYCSSYDLQGEISYCFYFVGFAFFAIESTISIYVIQQVYRYFRGSGKAQEVKRDAKRSTTMVAL
ncbi:SCAMP-like protein [Cynara cardunculus var. scolymus]|uniref:Secretory carrier-associated membrane protein n=1 Tax=Cynara cardunculus var. scolymus TaxID=59895 RepID=A0A118JX31_CYNCS|nr:SCAMP-like protein [Cynara cardunculus var. scolymus]